MTYHNGSRFLIHVVTVDVPSHWIVILPLVIRRTKFLSIYAATIQTDASLACVQMMNETENVLNVLGCRCHIPLLCIFCHQYWSHGHTCKTKWLVNVVFDWTAMFQCQYSIMERKHNFWLTATIHVTDY